MTRSDPLDDARVALEAARAGAAALAPFLGPLDPRRLAPTAKSDGSPVTAADQAASAAILASLATLAAGDLVVSEEAPPPPGAAAARRVWFVDPLDGTREFVAGIPEFCVMVGLVEGGAPAVGCIVDPHDGRAWLGLVGDGAFELVAGARVEELRDAARARPLRLTGRTGLAGAREVTSRFHEPEDLPRFAAWAGVGARTPCGSMGIKAVRLVTGATDFHLRPRGRTWYWDSAAPAALVLAAGGEVGSAAGPLRFDDAGLAHPDGFVLARPGLLEPLRAAWQGWSART